MINYKTATKAELLEEFERLKQLSPNNRFFTKKRIFLYFPQIAMPNETPSAISSGKMDGKTWLIILTNQRLIFLDKGIFSELKKVVLDLSHISSVDGEPKLPSGKITIAADGHTYIVENVSKKGVVPFTNMVKQAIEALKQDKEQSTNTQPSSDNNLQKNSILFKEIGFWSVFFTALLYVNAYICEGMTSIYFGFDVDLISLPISVIIKNSLIPFALITIAVIIILSNIKNDKKLTIDDVNTADNTEKYNILKFVGFLLFMFFSLCIYFNANANLEDKILVSVLGAIMSSVCGYFLDIKIIKNNSKLTHLFVASNIFFIFSCCYIYILVSWINLLLVIISILLLFISFCIYSIVQSDNILESYCWLAGLFICLVGVAGASSFYLVIYNFKPDQSFKYNEQDYILLRNYDGNLVAKKATIIQQEKYCFNGEILYLPKEILKEGLTFKKVNKANFEGDCKAKASNPTN